MERAAQRAWRPGFQDHTGGCWERGHVAHVSGEAVWPVDLTPGGDGPWNRTCSEAPGKSAQMVSLAPSLADTSLTAQGHWWPSVTAACPAWPGVASTVPGRVSHGRCGGVLHRPGANEGSPASPTAGVVPGTPHQVEIV